MVPTFAQLSQTKAELIDACQKCMSLYYIAGPVIVAPAEWVEWARAHLRERTEKWSTGRRRENGEKDGFARLDKGASAPG